MAAAAPPQVPPPPPWGATSMPINPPSRDELMDIDSELRKCYRAATLLPDGRSRRGRKTKHDTATRRWCDTVGFPAISMGKRPSVDDMAMLRLSPRSSLSGLDLKARDAWSQKHGRDPRSKQQTEAEKLAQQTLLSWARSNLLSALTPSAIRRGRTAAWQIDFGRSWRGRAIGWAPYAMDVNASSICDSKSS